jgi:anti-sigma B factor antagonist
MTITKTLNEKELVIGLEGRLDTTTSPELESELAQSLEGVETLIFDLRGLEYISSAGLRVLLSSQKKMSQQGGMKVRNVNEDIMDIFDITGFTEILTIEKAGEE